MFTREFCEMLKSNVFTENLRTTVSKKNNKPNQSLIKPLKKTCEGTVNKFQSTSYIKYIRQNNFCNLSMIF